MNERDFVYWLQGFFEILSAGPKTAEKLTLTAEQVEMVKTHLGYVFQHQEANKAPSIVFNPPFTTQPIQPVLRPENPQQQPWPGYPQPYATCQTGQGAQSGGQGGVQSPNMGAIISQLSKLDPLSVTC